MIDPSPRFTFGLLLCSLMLSGCGGSVEPDPANVPVPKRSAKRASSSPATGNTTTPTKAAGNRLVQPGEVQEPKLLSDTDTIIWNASRPLSWADFRSATEVTDGAITSVELFAIPDDTGGLRWHIQALFSRKRSAVRPDLKGNAQRLAHEQLHFDIAELHARELRRYLAGLQGSNETEIRQGFYRKFEAERIRIESDIRRYDLETRHGSEGAAQAGWVGDVRRRLASMERKK